MLTTPSLQAAREEVVQAINGAIATSTDAERGFAAAAADVRDPDLKEQLLAWSRERAEFVIALQREVQQLGAYALNEGTPLGLVHRGWMGLRREVEGRTDAAVLRECERGERAALRAYDVALQHVALETVPFELRMLLRHQRDAIARVAADLEARLVGAS